MRYARTVAFGAGFLLFFLALVIQGILPLLYPPPEHPTVAKVVEDKFGEFSTADASARHYTELEARGRKIYIREGCWYCHSQYVRPFPDENKRYGPTSQFDEYASEQPHLLGTRRIGPDLSRVGGKYSNDWHYAHLYDPRSINADSVMPSFPWLFEKDGVHRPTAEGSALVAYLQKLGTDIGDWQDRELASEELSVEAYFKGPGQVPGDVQHGKVVYEKKCAGCHGLDGRGKGRASAFLFPKPRDLVKGVFKFKSVSQGIQPTDADLFRTVTIGVPGSAMPSWRILSTADRWDVIAYIKTLSQVFKQEGSSSVIPEAFSKPKPSDELIKRGEALYHAVGCVPCHGKNADGKGVIAENLADIWGNKIRPANFKIGKHKSGVRVEDLFRTITFGLEGTPMPAWEKSLKTEERWALAYYVFSVSRTSPDNLITGPGVEGTDKVGYDADRP